MKFSVDMRSNTENFKWSEFLLDYKPRSGLLFAASARFFERNFKPPPSTVATGLSQFRNADPTGTRHRP